jgi:hypothetical protein
LKGELANRWEDANIEFIFSVPTTWKLPTIERFRSTIGRAGFGSSPSHKIEIGLTEAEAAAVHTARAFPRLFSVFFLPSLIEIYRLTTGVGKRRAASL